jgi:uncharacterized membrane protein
VRLILSRPSFASALGLAVGQPRRYGAGDPDVLTRIFQLLREVAWVTADDDHRAAVQSQLARTRAAAAQQDVDAAERSALEQAAHLVELALDGHWPPDQ